jgi:urease accessory protein
MIAGVVSGLTQFFLPTHLLAIVALGLLIGQGARDLPIQLACLALGLAIGSVMIALAMRETPAAIALLGLTAAAGLAVVLAWTPPAFLVGAVLTIAGAGLALNTPPQALTIPVAIVEQIGTAMAALVTLALVAFGAARATRSWQRIGVRILGSWIAASAILVLALRLAR